MTEIAALFARSTASGWALCVIGVAGLFGIWRLHVLARPKMLELEITRDTGLRQEFIDEMRQLRDEVKSLRDENGELRKEIRELHGIIDGMRRENLTANLAVQRDAIGDRPVSKPMERALGKLDEIAGETT